MMQPLIPRNGTAPLQPAQTTQWSTSWNPAPTVPPQAGGGQTQNTPTLPGDAARGLDGRPVLDAAAQAGVPEGRRFTLPAPPRVDVPAAVVPNVQLSGSTENRIAALTRVQDGQIAAIASGLRGLGFIIDPSKSSIGLSGTQQFYADVTGVLIGAEEGVKRSPEYQLFHQLYASMPSNLTDQQLQQLQGTWGRMRGFSQLVAEINTRRVQISAARAANDGATVRRLESEIAVITQRQQSGIGGLARELQALGFSVDSSKISNGLTGTQQFYNDLAGILVGAEDEIKRNPAFNDLRQLYASMPSTLTDQQLGQLRGVWAQIRGFYPISSQINGLRVQLVRERAAANR